MALHRCHKFLISFLVLFRAKLFAKENSFDTERGSGSHCLAKRSHFDWEILKCYSN